jgi:hypothetical protein
MQVQAAVQPLQRDAETLLGEVGAARELLQELREQLQQNVFASSHLFW